MTDFLTLYRRISELFRQMPWLPLLPVAIAILQHAIEALFGFHPYDWPVPPLARDLRLSFGLLKVCCLVFLLIGALRWWAFEGDLPRAARLSWRYLAGLLLFLLTQGAIELSSDVLEAFLARFRLSSQSYFLAGLAVRFAGLTLNCLLLAWSVGLLVEDGAMGLRRSVKASLPCLPWIYLVTLSGVLPLMYLHILLKDSIGNLRQVYVWPVDVLDALIVSLLATAIASSLFLVYDRIRKNSDSLS